MRGDLSETSAADACRQLAGDGLSGTLAIAGPAGPGGIVFDAGRILAATSPTPRARLGDRLVGAGFLEQDDLDEVLAAQRAADGQVRLGALLVERDLVPHDAVRLFVQEQVLDALFEIVSWRFGAFEFRSALPVFVPEVSLVLPVDDALVEVARRQQEWRELSQVIPDLDAVPTFSDQASAAASLEPDEFAVLASLDGERSVRSLASDLGYGEFELARIVYGLTLLGVVEIRLPQDAIGAALDDALAGGPSRAAGVDASGRPHLEPVPDPAPAPGDGAPDVHEDDEERPHPTAEEAPDDPGHAGVADAAGEPAHPDDPVDPVDPVGPDPASAVERTGVPVPSFSDVLREFRSMDALRDAAPGPPPATAPPADTTPDEDASAWVDAPPPEPAPPAPPPTPTGDGGDDDADVSEFLRELSRLSGEDQPPPPRSSRARKPGPRTTGDDGKRRKRGLFGRGG